MVIIYILFGLLGGILGGAGMGGGTLLIPLLTILISQHAAQAINLIVFIPASIAALIVHSKNKLVKFKLALGIGIVAAAASVGSAFLAKNLDEHILAICFGAFLILLGIFQFVMAVKKKKK